MLKEEGDEGLPCSYPAGMSLLGMRFESRLLAASGLSRDVGGAVLPVCMRERTASKLIFLRAMEFTCMQVDSSLVGATFLHVKGSLANSYIWLSTNFLGIDAASKLMQHGLFAPFD